jgi:hypothetical protein
MFFLDLDLCHSTVWVNILVGAHFLFVFSFLKEKKITKRKESGSLKTPMSAYLLTFKAELIRSIQFVNPLKCPITGEMGVAYTRFSVVYIHSELEWSVSLLHYDPFKALKLYAIYNLVKATQSNPSTCIIILLH